MSIFTKKAAASLIVMALGMSFSGSAASARTVGQPAKNYTAKDKMPSYCFEYGCKGSHCIYCKR
ncbi:MAG: hypothetical protein ACRCWF_08875 [Beijerinckiaceae bacterium]